MSETPFVKVEEDNPELSWSTWLCCNVLFFGYFIPSMMEEQARYHLQKLKVSNEKLEVFLESETTK